LLLLNVLTGAASGLAFPAHVALAMEQVHGAGMGTVMSLLLTVHSLGMMVGPLLFGFIADHISLGSAFYSAGLIGVLTTGVCYVLANAPLPEPQTAGVMKKQPVGVD